MHTTIVSPVLALIAHTQGMRLIYTSVFQGKVYLCSPGCPGTRSVDHMGFKLRDPYLHLPSTGLKVCAAMPGFDVTLKDCWCSISKFSILFS